MRQEMLHESPGSFRQKQITQKVPGVTVHPVADKSQSGTMIQVHHSTDQRQHRMRLLHRLRLTKTVFTALDEEVHGVANLSNPKTALEKVSSEVSRGNHCKPITRYRMIHLHTSPGRHSSLSHTNNETAEWQNANLSPSHQSVDKARV